MTEPLRNQPGQCDCTDDNRCIWPTQDGWRCSACFLPTTGPVA